MPLVELFTRDHTKQNVIEQVTNFLDIHLGKTIVKSNDTPGFIANRIGCYWLETALSVAIEMDISVEEADSLIGKPLGIPSTAIFGLYDLIGIDVMRLIANSLSKNLPADDDFLKSSKAWPMITKMIENGFIGRKGKGGFYRLTKDSAGNKFKEVMDLRTGEYHSLQNISAPSMSLIELMESSPYALRVVSKTLSYAASLVPEVSNNLSDIDQAMKLGYNWKYGPFELIDLIGPVYFKKKLEEQNIKVPKILIQVREQKFYQQEKYFTGSHYAPITRAEGIIFLNDFKNRPQICSNNSLSIWDIGDKIAAIELTSKMAILDHNAFNLIIQFFTDYISNFKGIVIANEQSNFSAGGNLKFMLEMAEAKNFKAIDDYLKLGQKMMLSLKYSPIPVVSALKGMALGGGCEMLLHSAGVVSHVEANVGLVEAGVGIIPGWGGCKESIMRSKTPEDKIMAFKNILQGIVSSSAHKLDNMLKLDQFRIVMNVNRVLAEAKKECIELAKNYKTPEQVVSNNIKVNLNQVNLDCKGYDQVIAKELESIFALTNASESDLLDKEREVFIRLLHNPSTLERIKYMLKNGKRLIN